MILFWALVLLNPIFADSHWACENNVTTQQLWEHDFFYSQANLIKIKKNVTNVDQIAQQELIKSGHRSYQSGECRSFKWILTFPSLKNIFNQKNYAFDMKKIKKTCKGHTLDFIYDKGQKSRPYKKGLHAKKGVAALTCYPSRYGPPEEWLLIPTGTLDKKVPHSQSFSMLDWVNRVRKDHKLKELKMLPFTSHKGLNHNRTFLKKLRTGMLKRSFEFIGENRVKAASLKESLFLLWHSPKHRDLLLSSGATHVFIDKKNEGIDQTVSLVLAKKTNSIR